MTNRSSLCVPVIFRYRNGQRQQKSIKVNLKRSALFRSRCDFVDVHGASSSIAIFPVVRLAKRLSLKPVKNKSVTLRATRFP